MGKLEQLAREIAGADKYIEGSAPWGKAMDKVPAALEGLRKGLELAAEVTADQPNRVCMGHKDVCSTCAVADIRSLSQGAGEERR